MALGIRYNSPVILTFALLSMAVYLINWIFGGDFDQNPGGVIGDYFVVHGTWNWSDWANYFRIFSYPLGHANLAHIVGNMSMFLLIGPIVEEKYGSSNVLKMFVITTLLTAVIQIILFDTGGLGASGLVFMLIVLVSFTEREKGGIPLTFILVVVFYLGQEVLNSMNHDNVSQYAHIAGGVMGGVFGFSAQKQEA